MEIIDENMFMSVKNHNNSELLITINVMENQIKVHKSILCSESDYFKAMLNSEWIETNTNLITLKERDIKPLIIVLKTSYELELDEIEVQELNEAIIIANKYLFHRVEEILSIKLMAKFTQINEMSSETYQTFLDIYHMSENKSLNFLKEILLKFFDENADEVIKKFDELLISHQMLFQIISRDSFGVKEIDLFKALMKWIAKTRIKLSYDFYEEEELLLKTIKFNLISDEDIENTVKPSLKKLFIALCNDSVIETKIETLIKKNLNKNNRICIQTEKCFTVKTDQTMHYSYQFNDKNEEQEIVANHELPENQLRTYSNSVIYTFNLILTSKINCVKFKIMPNNNSRNTWDQTFMSYIIEVQESDGKDGNVWKTVVNYSDEKCIGLQELYFEECVTNSIRIVHKSIEQLFKIYSISYKYTKNPLKLHDNIVKPLNELTVINGLECLIGIENKERNITYHILRDYKYETIIKDLLMKMDIKNEFNTNYYIKFSQPFAINCFQFKLITENDNSNVKSNAFIEVSIARELSFDLLDHNWVKVAENEIKVKESLVCNVEFELKIVSMIRICGFRTCSGDSTLPLVISNVRVPADQLSPEWICGQTLSHVNYDQ